MLEDAKPCRMVQNELQFSSLENEYTRLETIALQLSIIIGDYIIKSYRMDSQSEFEEALRKYEHSLRLSAGEFNSDNLILSIYKPDTNIKNAIGIRFDDYGISPAITSADNRNRLIIGAGRAVWTVDLDTNSQVSYYESYAPFLFCKCISTGYIVIFEDSICLFTFDGILRKNVSVAGVITRFSFNNDVVKYRTDDCELDKVLTF